MKSLIKSVLIAAAICMTASSYAQSAVPNTETPPVKIVEKTQVEIQAKDITLSIKNSCGAIINLYAGPKKDVFNGRSEQLGGHSTNSLYLKEGDIVCIMKDPKTIQACTQARAGMTKVEINPSGNGFVK